MNKSTENIIKGVEICVGIVLAIIFSYVFLELCFFEQVSVVIVIGFAGAALALSIMLRNI